MNATPGATGSTPDADSRAMIELVGVGKRYPDGTVAVRDLDLQVPRGEIVTLVGPSGSGKTTVLKMVNRLIEPTSGRIVIDGDDITRVDPVQLRRGIGYVIQQSGLFPHRTVRDNVATVPNLIGWERRRTRSRVDEMLTLVGLEPELYGDRYPHQLSGGQRQRAGVARALAADPPVMLMDEPFGAVDPVVRERLQNEFLRLQREVRKTIMFVTHDIEEAVLLGDRVAVFSQGGVLEQYDPPATILGNPANEFVADFVGADRGLKRLSVTRITDADLERPPVVGAVDTLDDAGAEMRAEGARWAVVLDTDGALRGWISVDEAHGSGRVVERARRMEAWVEVDANLKVAFSEMLQYDAGWVAVLDGNRFVGVLTPTTLHEALRRSVDADASGRRAEDVEIETVANV
jgi:osmoprotectant transport system ATP-binding protein